MTAPLRRVALRRPNAMLSADADRWHYAKPLDPIALVKQFGAFADLVAEVWVALLRDDTRFWVVRPRLGKGGISGIGTIMSGAYIELEPGPGEPSGKRDYVGLEDLPLTPVDAPGLWLTLVGTRAGSIDAGQPVLFRGYPVGRIEERVFDPEGKELRYKVFKLKMEQVEATEAEALYSSCANCRQTFDDCQDHYNWKYTAESLLELVAENLVEH